MIACDDSRYTESTYWTKRSAGFIEILSRRFETIEKEKRSESDWQGRINRCNVRIIFISVFYYSANRFVSRVPNYDRPDRRL